MPGGFSSGFDSGFGNERQSTYGKAVMFHVYTSAGVVIRTWPDIVGFPHYQWPINSGPGSLTVRLPRPWGAAGEPGETGSLSDIQHGNLVKVYVLDRETWADGGRLVWQGSLRHYTVNRQGQVFDLTLVPRTVALMDYVISTPLTFVATDPTQMVKYLVDNSLLPGITWDPASPNVGLTFDLTYESGTIAQFLEIVRGLAGGRWYYRLNPDNSLSFNQWSLKTATHRLVIGRHVDEKVTFERSSLEVRKRVYFYGDTGVVGVATSPGYSPATEALDEAIANPRVTDQALANRLAAAELERREPPTIGTSFEVLDSNADPERGYDIESLRPGDTVSLVDPGNAFSFGTWIGEDIVGAAGLIMGGTWFQQTQHPYVVVSVDYGFLAATLKLANLNPILPGAVVGLQDDLFLAAAR